MPGLDMDPVGQDTSCRDAARTEARGRARFGLPIDACHQLDLEHRVPGATRDEHDGSEVTVGIAARRRRRGGRRIFAGAPDRDRHASQPVAGHIRRQDDRDLGGVGAPAARPHGEPHQAYQRYGAR